MSEAAAYPFKCERCGADNQGTVWHSVNVTVDPELKQKLLDGSLMRLVCERCGNTKSVIYDFLYHDQNARYMIWLKYPDKDGVSRFEGSGLEMTAKFFGRAAPDYRLRVVQSWNSLIEKILIFDAGLDDRAIEISKLTLLAAALDRRDASPNDEILFSRLSTDNSDGKQLVYLALGADRASRSYSEPWDKYLATVTALGSEFGVRDGGPCEWEMIDRQYVRELVGKNKGPSRIQEA